jgi:hypothetical protein
VLHVSSNCWHRRQGNYCLRNKSTSIYRRGHPRIVASHDQYDEIRISRAQGKFCRPTMAPTGTMLLPGCASSYGRPMRRFQLLRPALFQFAIATCRVVYGDHCQFEACTNSHQPLAQTSQDLTPIVANFSKQETWWQAGGWREL